MRKLTAGITLGFLLLTGCVVRTGPRHHHDRGRPGKVCPPAHHWNGFACVHNGNGKHKGHK